MTLSPLEERELHRRELALQIAKTERSVAGLETEITYCKSCLEIERAHLASLKSFIYEPQTRDP